jgi:uridine kinase
MSQAFQKRGVLRQLFLHPLVLGVLALKLVAAALFTGAPMTHWFAPFVGYFVSHPGQDPWAAFLALGQPKAFPYPPGMLYLFAIPRWLAQPLLGGSWWEAGPLQLLLMRLPLLGADLLIFALLGLWFRDRLATVRLWWWCSPVVFYVAYFHGQLDLVPTALFLLALFLLERRRSWAAFLVYGLALSTKAHLWIALPFLLIYLRGRLPWPRLLALAALAAGVALLLSLPWALREPYQEMVLRAPEQAWVFRLGLPMGQFGVSVLLCPAALLFILARFAAYPRHNWDLTVLFLGLAFGVFVLLVPPMPGWYLWSLPFLIYFFCRFRQSPTALLVAFSLSYLAYFVLGDRSDLAEGLSQAWPSFHWPGGAAADFMGPLIRGSYNDLYFTLLQASLMAILLAMLTRGIRSNEVYGARSKPLMIGIAGDSAAGKDTLAAGLASLLGEHDVVRLAGDDYHRWERGDQNWAERTHLDPRANRLHQQLAHTVALREGRGIAQAEYDHGTGRFTAPRDIDPGKNVIVQGLHTFLLERMRQQFDLKVFLDPEERLRLYWKLRRDSLHRGQSPAAVRAAVRKRAKDRDASIVPQRDHADLVFRLYALRPAELKDLKGEPALGLEVLARNSIDLEGVAEAVGQLPSMHVQVDYLDGLSHVRARFKGGPLLRSEIDRLALQLVPNGHDLVGTQPQFADGWEGLMALVVLVAVGSSAAGANQRGGGANA